MSDIAIRPVRVEDAEVINEIRRQPRVMEFTTGMPSERIAGTRAFIEGLGVDAHVLVAETRGRVIGMAGLHAGRGKRRHTASVGIMVHDEFQGRGAGMRLMEALLDIADNYLGLVRVELEVLSSNARAIALYEKLGFAHEGTKLKDSFQHGRFVDVLMMGRVRG